VTGKLPTSPDGCIVLDTLALTAESEMLSLRRRARARAVELGAPPAVARSLSMAAYEAGRLLLPAAGPVLVEIRALGEPAIEVRLASAAPLGVLASGLQTLGGLVDRLATEEQGGRLTVVLHTRLAACPLPAPETAANEPSSLQGSIRELQAELEETNRGVVALYAELDGQAEKLRSAEDRLRVLLDSVQDYAICMLNLDGEVASWNSGAERIFGYSADEIVGRNVRCFYTPAERDLDLPAEHLALAREAGRFESEGLRVRRGGSAFDAHVVIAPVRGVSPTRGFSLVVRDVTERKRLEDDLRRRAEDLADANRAKEDFLATLSHELRTPLNAMLGWTRLLRMGKLDGPAMARALETIERNAHIQEQLIADILDVSRIVTGKLRIELRPIELAPVVEAAVDAVRPAADAKGIALFVDLSGSGTVLGDPDRLQQVIWNLVANAIKFTPASGRVSLSLQRVGPSAVLTVQDTGEGIAADLLPYVFDRFTQGDGSVTRPHGGLGLGLSIVRHLVELHGGQVQAWSEGAGRGSTFAVHLPIRAVQDAEASFDAEPMPPPLTGLRVLVVDDDADARTVVSDALAQCGASTAAAASAREALQVIHEFRPDVLVSDIAMPGEDGYALIRRVRALGTQGIGDVPAVALTGFAEAEDRRRALMAGFQQFVPKPVEADALAAVVRTLAGRRS
jgi:PAS domain S-box-containing protein